MNKIINIVFDELKWNFIRFIYRFILCYLAYYLISNYFINLCLKKPRQLKKKKRKNNK